MTKTEAKLRTLKNGKNKMAPGGNRTSEVSRKVLEVKTAFQDYIKSDNISASEKVTDVLSFIVEEHGDFDSALYYINRAIYNTQIKVNEEKLMAENKE